MMENNKSLTLLIETALITKTKVNLLLNELISYPLSTFHSVPVESTPRASSLMAQTHCAKDTVGGME